MFWLGLGMLSLGFACGFFVAVWLDEMGFL